MLHPWQVADPRREHSLAQIEAGVVNTLEFLRARPLDTNWQFPAPDQGTDQRGTDQPGTAQPGTAQPGTAQPAAPAPVVFSTVTPLAPWVSATADRVGTLVRRQGSRGLANGFSHMLSPDRAGVVTEEVLATARRVVVARGVKRFRTPGRSRIYVRSTKEARQTLRGKNALKLVVRITFQPIGSGGSTRRSATVP